MNGQRAVPDAPARDPRHAAPRATRVLVQSAVTAALFRLVNIAGGLITLPLILSTLTASDFGIWIVMSQSVSLLALSELGTSNAIGRYVAQARGREAHGEIAGVLTTAALMLAAAAALLAGLTVALAWRAPAWVGIDAVRQPTATLVFLIVGLGLAAQLPLRIAYGALIGHQMYGLHVVGKVAESLLTAAGIVILHLSNALTLVTLALLSAAAALAAQIVLYILAWRVTGPWALSWRRASPAMARQLLSLGGSALVMTVAAMIYTQGTGILAARLLGVSAAGVYGVALTVVGNLHPLITSIASPLATLSSEWQARRDVEQLRRTSMTVMRLTLATSACVAVGLVMFGEPALRLWLRGAAWSDADLSAAGRVVAIMGVALAFGLPQIGARATLQGVGQHWQVGVGVLAASVVSTAAGAAAMAGGWGVTGAAIGWGLVWVIQGTVLLPPLIARYLGIPIGRMIAAAYLPGTAVAGAALVVALILNQVVAPDSTAAHALVAAATALTAGLGLLCLAPASWLSRLRMRRA